MTVWNQGGGQSSLQGSDSSPQKLPSHLEKEQGVVTGPTVSPTGQSR